VKDDAILRQNMEHLNKIVEQILDFAHSTEPNLSAVNVNQLLEDLGLLTRHKMRNQRVELVSRLAPGLPLVLADATQLAQAFLNLTLNAVQAMPGGGTLAISTRALRLPRTSSKPTHVLIEFADTGQGMPEEQRRRAFTSLLSTTKQRGTGLGLAIVGRVIETHRGKVKISSQPGKGTTFSITLPAQ
jgi:signal transduction histidine kinase